MTRKRLPTRPDTSTRYTLSEAERYALCVFCVFETTKIDAFKLAHPEVVGTKNVLKSRCDEFFASSDVVNFMREYRAYLDGLDKEEKTEAKANVSQEDREERKRRALEMLADDLIDQIFALRAGGEEVDRETIMKMVDRIGWLGDEEVRVEEPRDHLQYLLPIAFVRAVRPANIQEVWRGWHITRETIRNAYGRKEE